MNKRIHIFGGGTVSHIASHLALSAPAYGTTARKIAALCSERFGDKLDVKLELTNMAIGGHGPLNTPEDIATRVAEIVANHSRLSKTKIFLTLLLTLI